MKNSKSYLDDDEELKSVTESKMSSSDRKKGGSNDNSSDEEEEVDISIKQDDLIVSIRFLFIKYYHISHFFIDF